MEDSFLSFLSNFFSLFLLHFKNGGIIMVGLSGSENENVILYSLTWMCVCVCAWVIENVVSLKKKRVLSDDDGLVKSFDFTPWFYELLNDII